MPAINPSLAVVVAAHTRLTVAHALICEALASLQGITSCAADQGSTAANRLHFAIHELDAVVAHFSTHS